MSSVLSNATNTSSIIQNAINSLTPITNGSVTNGSVSLPLYTSNTSSSTSSPFNSKVLPTFKMELFKSENGGFILNLITGNGTESSKLFILNNVETLGVDIQNILLVEILKK